jgi:hypothetical protein
MISLESYHQTYTYDTGNNLTNLLALCLIVSFNNSADSSALIVVDTILCGIGFVCFNESIQGIVVKTAPKTTPATNSPATYNPTL